MASVEMNASRSDTATKVAGSDPRSVLHAYCRSGAGLEPLGTFQSMGDWTGLLRREDQLLSIKIGKDPATRLWVVGNGEEPIVPASATPYEAMYLR